MQGARCGTQSWASRIMPWAKGSAKQLSYPGCPSYLDEVPIIHFCFSFSCLHGCILQEVTVAKFKKGVACVFFFLRFYLFTHERHRERERDRNTGRGRSRLHAGSPMWDSVLRLCDHALSQRQMLNH